MLVQPRDQQILSLCYEHGFLSLFHLDTFFPSQRERRKRVAQYRDTGLVEPHAPLPNWQPVYCLTRPGIEFVESFYPAVIQQRRHLSMATFLHDSKVISARLRICSLWDGCWTPESRLPRAREEIPDGIFTFSSGKKVFVEVENSLKSRPRFLKKLAKYEEPLFTLYVATSPFLENALKRYLSAETRSAGVISLPELAETSPAVWTRTKVIHPFSRRSF